MRIERLGRGTWLRENDYHMWFPKPGYNTPRYPTFDDDECAPAWITDGGYWLNESGERSKRLPANWFLALS